jgi:OmpA-OmpF porin, OOP family
MKKILAVLLALSAFIPSSFGQDDEIRPAAIGISFFLNDFATAGRIRTTSLSQVLVNKQWAKASQMSPGLAISYFKGLRKHVDFAGTLASSFVRYSFPNRLPFSNDKFLLEADASLNLKMVSEKYWFTPYLIAGVGGHIYGGKYFGAFIPLGLGLKFNFYDETHLFITSQYRVPVTTETSSYHFFNQFGIAGTIGKKKEPKIITPPTPPLDTDKDGIIDSLDKCPTVPGLAKYEGCPIPDTDKDGLNDEEDKCPTVPGLARYQGCPLVDTDNDGVPDEDDKCPTVPGTKENNGCPDIKQEEIKKVDYAANNIYFATGKYVLLAKSFKGLGDVAQILKDNTQLHLAIDGHTDAVGSDASNQTLSENRANAVKNYLVKKGVEESRLVVTGHGESEPIADNKTGAGRQKNRRVELKLNY